MPVTVAAVITAHDRREFLPEAIRSAETAGADEVIVVRNFGDAIPGAPRGGFTDLFQPAPETGIKAATGVLRANADVICFLDDDDLWEPTKVARVRDWFSGPTQYACHFQTPVDAEGRPVVARHAEWGEKNPERVGEFSRVDFRTRYNRIWPGNNSSTCVRRSWAVEFVPWLLRAGWGADTFWLVAATVSRAAIRISPERLTRLRLHTQNMSQTRGSDMPEFRERHRIMCERFAKSTDIMVEMVRSSPQPPCDLVRFLEERALVFRYWTDLESGRLSRRNALDAFVRGPKWDRAFASDALLAVFSPSSARRAVYRASLRRWATS